MNNLFTIANYHLINGIMLVITIMGTLFNILLINIMNKVKFNSCRFNIQLVRPISYLDLAAGFLFIFSYILGVTREPNTLDQLFWYCPLIGNLSLTLNLFSILLVSALAVDRCCCICYNIIIKYRKGWFLLGLIAFFIFIVSTGNGIKRGFELSSLGIFCIPIGSKWATAQFRITVTVLLLSLMLTTFSYISIFIKCFSMDQPSEYFISRKLAFRFLIPLIFYNVCWLPELIYIILRIRNDHIPFFAGLSLISFSLSLIINPLLVIYLQCDIKQEFLKLCYSLFNQNNAIISQDSQPILN